MKKNRLLFFILVSLSRAVYGADVQSFSEPYRQNYLQEAIEVISRTDLINLKRVREAVEFSEKQKCRALFEPVTLACLKKEAEGECGGIDGTGQSKRKACTALWDMAITNRLNEKQFISKSERFEISEKSVYFSEGFTKALHAKYGLLTTQMLFFSQKHCKSDDTPCLARQIDHYCIANADTNNLPWQGCVSAIVWFMGLGR